MSYRKKEKKVTWKEPLEEVKLEIRTQADEDIELNEMNQSFLQDQSSMFEMNEGKIFFFLFFFSKFFLRGNLYHSIS